MNKRLTLIGVDTGGGLPVIDGNRRIAIKLSSDGITLKALKVTNSGWSDGGIKIESNNNIITGNIVSNNEGYGIESRFNSNNTLKDNYITHNKNNGIFIAESNNNIIINNIISNNSDGIVLIGSDYPFNWDEIPGKDSSSLTNLLTQNFGIDWVKRAKIEKIDNDKTIRVSTEKNSLWLRLNDGKTKVNIEIDNDRTYELTTKTGNGKLYIYFQSYNNIIKNNIASNNNHKGIKLILSTNNNIEGNNINSNNVGIDLFESNNNTLSKNNANFSSEGINLYNSDNNILEGNIADNNIFGIWLSGSSNNILIGNTANNNQEGIHIPGSSYLNVLYKNNFMNNDNWDSGYNYWDNGIDTGNHYSNFDEPAEGCTDSDINGICDSNYSIPYGSNVDRFPMVFRSVPTATPAPALTPPPIPMPTDVVSRYAASDDIGHRNGAVQAVKDYLSGTITILEAIKIVMAYFRG